MSRLRPTSPPSRRPLHHASPQAPPAFSRASSSQPRKRPLDGSERKEEDNAGSSGLPASPDGSIIPPPRSTEDDEDDAVSDLLNGPPSTPLPRRLQQPAVLTSSPLTIAHFDSPLRSHASPLAYHQHQRDSRDRLHPPTQRVLQLSSSSTALRASQLLNGQSDALLLSLDHWRLRLLSSHFVAWREHKTQAKQERQRLLLSLQHWSRRLQGVVFSAWQDRTRRGDWLLEVWRRRQEATVMRAWRGYAARRRELYAVAHRVADRGEDRLLRAAWRLWRSDALLLLTASRWQVGRKCREGVQRWTEAVLRRRERVQRREMVEAARARSQEAAVTAALQLWSAQVQERKEEAERQRRAEQHRLRVVMIAWRTQLPQEQQNRMRRKRETAVGWHEHRALRQAVTAWRQWWTELRQLEERASAERRQRTLLALWTAWRRQWAQTRSSRQRDEEMARQQAEQRAATAFACVFHHWQQRTVAIVNHRQQLIRASQLHKARILFSSLRLWLTIARRQAARRAITTRADERHRHRLQAAAWAVWLRSHRQAAGVKLLLHTANAARLTEAWDGWRETVLQRTARDWSDSRQRQRMAAALSRWRRDAALRRTAAAASSVLSQHADNSRVQAAFHWWRSSFIIRRHRRMSRLRQCFSSWQRALRMRAERQQLLLQALRGWQQQASQWRQQRLHFLLQQRQRRLLPAVLTLHFHAQHRREEKRKQEVARSHHERRLSKLDTRSWLRTAYLAWFYYTQHRRQLQDAAAAVRLRQQQHLLLDAMASWRQQTLQLRLAAAYHSRYEQMLVVTDWRQWARQRQEGRERASAATQLRQHSQSERARQSLQCWLDWSSQQRLSHHLHRLAALFHVRRLFRGWRLQLPTDEGQSAKEREKRAMQHRAVALARRMLRGWKAGSRRGVEERERQERDCRQLTAHRTLRHAWESWQQRSAAVISWSSTAAQHLAARQRSATRQLFARWRQALLQTKQEQQMMARASRYRTVRLVHACCLQWTANSRLQRQQRSISLSISARSQQHRLLAAWSTWRQGLQLLRAATTLAAIADRLQQLAALQHWKEAMLAAHADAFSFHRQQRLLASSLIRWQQQAMQQQQLASRQRQLQLLSSSFQQSSALRRWVVSFRKRKHDAAATAAVRSQHSLTVLRQAWKGWKTQRVVHRQLRLLRLHRLWQTWKAEMKARKVERTELTVAVREWRRRAQEERQREASSVRLMRLQALRHAMQTWSSRAASRQVFQHWRRLSLQRLLLSQLLTSAAAHHDERRKRDAVLLLREHCLRSQRRALLTQQASQQRSTQLLRSGFQLWARAAKGSRALAVLVAFAARQQQLAALSSWQEAAWQQRADDFHQHRLQLCALDAVRGWQQLQQQKREEQRIVSHLQLQSRHAVLLDSFRQWLHSLHAQAATRAEEAVVQAEHEQRVRREVLVWWFNCSVVRRQSRLWRLRAAWTRWTARMQQAAELKRAKRAAFIAWRDAARQRHALQQRVALRCRRRRLSSGLVALRAFSQASKKQKRLQSQAALWERRTVQRRLWTVWSRALQLSQAMHAQLSLADSFHRSTVCILAVRSWRDAVSEQQRRRALVLSLQEGMQRRQQSFGLRRWVAQTKLRQAVKRLQAHTLRPAFVGWKRALLAVRTERQSRRAAAWRQWRAAMEEAVKQRKAERMRQITGLKRAAAAFRAWKAAVGAQSQQQLAVRGVGEKLSEERRMRTLRLVLEVMRTTVASSRSHSEQLTAAADALHRRHLLSSAMAAWLRQSRDWRGRRLLWEKEADACAARALQRRVLELWEERTGERLKTRHLLSSRAVRLSIGMRSYHTSLLLQTFSVWRAAFLASRVVSPALSASSSSSLSTLSSHPRLASMREVRAFITAMHSSSSSSSNSQSHSASAPPTPLTATDTDTDTASPSSTTGTPSRPSTVGSGRGRAGDAQASRGGGAGKRLLNGGAPLTVLPRIDMRDL